MGASRWIQHGPSCFHPTGSAEPQAVKIRHRVDDYDRVEFYRRHTGRGGTKSKGTRIYCGKGQSVNSVGAPAKALASTAKTKRQSTTSRGRKRLVKPSDDEPVAAQDLSKGDVEIVEAPFAPMVPIPAFITATLMEDYESDPIELCWQTIEGICRRASADDDEVDASRLAEVASYVPQWLFSTAINVRLAANSSTPFGVANRTARHLRLDAWTQGVHRQHLAVRARSIIGTDAATRSGSGTEDVIRNLSSILERQVATGVSFPPPEKSPFDAFPPTTRQLVLFASELTPDGMAPTQPIKPFMEALALTNVAFMQNHMHNFLRHSKNLDVQIASGVCAAIRTGTFTSGATDRPGAFSLFCCGPQVIEVASSGGKEADKQTNRRTV